VLGAAADAQAEFFRMWTFKEAVIKADGRGVGLDLTRVSSLGSVAEVEGARWHVRRIPLHEGYDAHLACDRDDIALAIDEAALATLIAG
jgi:4'-phosphopantetheinyl transferase